ncbi:MAG: sulfotransferase family protein [Solirubrobacteraceae bacterium]
MTSSAERRPPDFYVVGHPKSGTTALYEMLRSHPQVFMPELKEPRWFATDLRERFEGPDRRGAGRLPQTYEQYLDLFAPAAPGQLTGEASPSYLRSRVAAGLIAQARPDARVIAILREPARFLRSLHLELVQNHVEREQDLRVALAGERRGADGLLRYSDRIAYVEQLRRYHEAFRPEQVLVLIYDDFRADNAGTMRRVLRFLGLDEQAPLRLVEANPSVEVRSLRLDRLMRRVYGAQSPPVRALKDAVKRVTGAGREGEAFGALRRRLVYAPPRSPDEALMDELREQFAPQVQALSDYLGRDLLALWGYERHGG